MDTDQHHPANTPKQAETQASTVEQRDNRETQHQKTDQYPGLTRRAVAAILATLLAAILVLSGCTPVASDAEYGELAEYEEHDTDLNAATPINTPGWEHTISRRRGSTLVVVVNRDVGRATVERLEHIAETLDRIAVLLENRTENDSQQQPTSPAPDGRTGQQDNDGS